MGVKNDPKAKRSEWPPQKHCTEHMEVMQAMLTALDRWPRPLSLLLTVLNEYLFNLIKMENWNPWPHFKIVNWLPPAS